jgi:hypothetical protein
VIRLVRAIESPKRSISGRAGRDIAHSRLRNDCFACGGRNGIDKTPVLLIENGRRFSHEALPNARGQGASGNPLHRRVIIISNPYTGYKLLVEAHKPGIPVLLARACLPGCKAIEGGCSSSAMIDDATQEADQFSLMCERFSCTAGYTQLAQWA